MKRLISIILAVTIIASVGMTTAFAKCSISDTLGKQMETSREGEMIRVNIWVNGANISEERLHIQAMKDVGFELWEFGRLDSYQMNEYIMARRRIETAKEKEACQAVIDKLGIAKENVNYTVALCINAMLTKEQIETASACNDVNAIYYDSQVTMPSEAPTENQMIVSTETSSQTEKSYLFEEKFKELLAKEYSGEYTGYHYNELYYHYDENGEIDWVLFEGTIDGLGPLYGHSFVGNRLITQRNGLRPFFGKMGIYSVKYDGVYDVALIKHEYFDDLEAVYDEIGYGVLMGDLDHDDEISIADVTVLQRCLVGMRDFPMTDGIDVLNDNYLHGVHYYSDFNRDGVRDILDATCIQRYLADLPYPVG